MTDNINIYDIIGIESDPIHQFLSKIGVGEKDEFNGYTITRGSFYEVEHSNNIHIGFKSIEECYHFLVSEASWGEHQ